MKNIIVIFGTIVLGIFMFNILVADKDSLQNTSSGVMQNLTVKQVQVP